ncbi:hypothetical protein J437_LFUL014378 [Ladona fulva]|uniref:SPIN-DOC-like zinc-finger domain-containing protein n=1 Tax=Ladona fulva TaxID=123851 RepID=A0A8K0P421_LADFU|nr:hypothetical protein J437_LFUL014378 [Ladona fulva]
MSAKEPPKKKARTYRYSFHEEWEEKYFFTNLNGKCFCLICHSSVSVGKKCNIERHFMTVHKYFESEYPSKSDLRKSKVKELKTALKEKQALYVLSGCKSKAFTIASFKVAHLLALKKRPIKDGELIKSCIIAASESLFHAHKNKNEILPAIRDIQLSESVIAERIQLMSNCSSKEDLLAVIPISDGTQAKDIYQAFKNYVSDSCFPLQKLVSITTDGSPSMIDSESGFISFCKKDADFPNFFSYHCIIQQHALFTDVIHFDHIIKIFMNVVKSLHFSTLQNRLFKTLLDECEEDFSMMMLYSGVRLLEKGKVLQEFYDLLPDIMKYLDSKDEHCDELSDPLWQLNLAFLADVSAKICNLNFELQEKGKSLSQMIGSVNAFKSKLNLWIAQIKRNVFSHFPCIEKMMQSNSGFDLSIYCKDLEEIKKSFEVRFADFNSIQSTATFLLNPFVETDISEMSAQVANSNLQLKARSSERDFWNMVEKEKYPLLKETFQRINACFGSTYMCESGFSTLELLNCRSAFNMNDTQIQNCMRLAISPYIPEFEKFVENMLDSEDDRAYRKGERGGEDTDP